MAYRWIRSIGWVRYTLSRAGECFLWKTSQRVENEALRFIHDYAKLLKRISNS